MKPFIFIFLILTFLGPLWITLSGQVDFSADWRTANRVSAKLAPNSKKHNGAIIQVYSARTFSWRGIFAMHTWIATKNKNSDQYKVYQVIGWRQYRGLPALMAEKDVPDRLWFNNEPEILLDIRGEQADKLIPEIIRAAEAYPYPNQYHYWPGPNSNTFTAFIARQVPSLGLTLPANAIGKDFLGDRTFFAKAPSGTGYQISLWGIFGIMLAKDEGLEINLLGLVYGISPKELVIKLPGFGNIGFRQLSRG